MASTDLIWHLIKKNNSFLVRRDRCAFSSEPGNLRNLHSRRFSGLAQKRAIDIQPAPKGKSVILSVKAAKPSLRRKPAKEWRKKTLKKDFRRNARAIKGAARKYRPDLRSAALARYSRLYWIAKSKGVAKKPVTRKARRAAALAAKKTATATAAETPKQ